ncbi:MAG: sugar nucleotide-binding protein [Candidatus Fermentibacteraceae bacterium]|nr:sugar nucleotide-binding protein [Candidatus Fermentibacteraceae bacterium]
MNPPPVLLAGATGRLGSAIREDLSERWNIRPVSGSGRMKTEAFDLLSSKDRKQLLNHDFDLIVNAAAISEPSECVLDPLKSWRLNTLWPRRLAIHCAAQSIPMIHFSTDLVYSGGIPPYTESSPAVPSSLYGWTKLIGDRFVLNRYPEALIIRTSVLCGEVNSTRTTFSQDILAGRVRNVYVNCWRNHTPIHRLAGILPYLLEKPLSGIQIVAGKYAQSRSAYAEELLRNAGEDPSGLILTYAPPDIPSKLHLRGRSPLLQLT